MTSELPRLVLYFDVNATVIITDPAARLSLDEALDKALNQPDWDGSEQPDWNISFKKNNSEISKEGLLKALRWPNGVEIDEKLCNGEYHFIFPSFFKTVTQLAKEKREFTIVFRTFGSDLERIRTAMNEYAAGNHPLYNYDGCEELFIPTSRMWKGRYGNGEFIPEGDQLITPTSTASYTLTNHAENHQTTTLTFEEDIISALECRNTPRAAVACQDHYEWWKFHKYIPSSGKPMWITEDDKNVHHIFFDDCIHKSASDSIISVRHRKTGEDNFKFMTGEEIINLHGCNTVRCQTVDAIMDPNYFLNKIKECEDAEKRRQEFYRTEKREN